MRLVTWNVNSVRLRLPALRRLIDWLSPDVICLQETKVEDGHFPAQAIAEMGYAHQAAVGMKSYNGVAIVSRLPLDAVESQDWCGRADARHVQARVAGIDVHSLYVPAGGDLPDPEANPRFAHKLAFLDAATAWFAQDGMAERPMLLLGDFNIAPLPADVWSHEKLLGVVSHTPVEVERLAALQASAGWIDAVRTVVPPPVRLYTWWSYRAADWTAGDRGRRLDHCWMTAPLAGRLTQATVLREARGWERPSDHVPVAVDLAEP